MKLLICLLVCLSINAKADNLLVLAKAAWTKSSVTGLRELEKQISGHVITCKIVDSRRPNEWRPISAYPEYRVSGDPDVGFSEYLVMSNLPNQHSFETVFESGKIVTSVTVGYYKTTLKFGLKNGKIFIQGLDVSTLTGSVEYESYYLCEIAGVP